MTKTRTFQPVRLPEPPLNPPLIKGDFLAKGGFPPLKKGKIPPRPPLQKGGWGDLNGIAKATNILTAQVRTFQEVTTGFAKGKYHKHLRDKYRE